MTRPRLESPPNCSSGIPIFLLGLISVGAGLRHSNALCLSLGLSLVAVTVAVFCLLRLCLRGVRVTRVVRESAFEGDTVEVDFLLHNRSRLPIFYPSVLEVFSPEVHAQKTTLFPYRIVAGETAVETYRGDCILPRGVYTLGPAWLTVSDPFGWFQLRKKVADPTRIRVYPRFQPFGVAERLGSSLSLLFNDITRFGVGDSNEFFSVREYRPGDPLRRLHWGLTAHRGYPVVRENTRTAVGDLHLFLDLYRYALLGVGRGSSLEQAVKIAAALAAHAVRRGHRVELRARGSQEFRVPPGKGKGQLKAILNVLVEVKPDGEDPLTEILDRSARGVDAGATAVFMVSPYLHSSEGFRSRLCALRRRGVRVVLVIFDAVTFRNLYDLGHAEVSAAEYAQQMARLGMRTVLVPCAASLSSVFAGVSAPGVCSVGGVP